MEKFLENLGKAQEGINRVEHLIYVVFPLLKDKKILLRADFDIPVSDGGQIEESFRIKRQKETLDYLVGHGAKVVMVAHISDQSVSQSFAGICEAVSTGLRFVYQQRLCCLSS